MTKQGYGVMDWQVHWFDTLDSTNTYLREWAADMPELPAGTVVAAREQTAGRGRQQRRWVAAAGRDLAFTFLTRESVPLQWMPSLPMAVALGVADFLRDEYGLVARVKWPNDVRVAHRKICGILAERVSGATEGVERAVVGVGINVNMPSGEAEAIAPPATSVLRETGMEHDVGTALDAVLPHIERSIATWREGGFDAIRSAWLKRCDFVGDSVTIERGGNSTSGTLEGFDEFGALLLRKEDGGLVAATAGDVSLRRA